MEYDLKNKKVLVTGGCGFIGSHIVERLVELKAKVMVLDNLSTGNLDNIKTCLNKIDFIQGDIRDDKILDKILDNVDYISHQAALRSVPKSIDYPLDYHDVNVTGILKLFLKAREKGVKRIVAASSSSVYGERDSFPQKETDNCSPISPYAVTKLIGEYYASFFYRIYNLEIVFLRYFNVYGPRQSLEDKYAVVIPKFIVSLLKHEPVPIYGDGRQERDFTYVGDVARANILALSKPGIGGEVFNIAQGKPHSVNRLFEILKEITGKDVKPDYFPQRRGDIKKSHADIEKARKLLGWKPEVKFSEGLESAVDYFKKKYGLS